MQDGKQAVLNDEDFFALRSLVYQNIGVNLTDAKRSLVISRLSKRLRELNITVFSDYMNLIKTNSDELEILFNLITTNVTKFFREEHHFNYLTDVYLPNLEQQAGSDKKTIRAWSAACSTGEEPYTLAMVLHNYFEKKKDWKIKILASDINTETLSKAENGIYTKDEVSDIPYNLLTKHFMLGTGENKGLFKVKDELKKLISFKQINLTGNKPFPIGDELNFIFCRNVFIYFDKETQGKVLSRFNDHLSRDGILFLGHSESIHTPGSKDVWRLIRHTIYEKA